MYVVGGLVRRPDPVVESATGTVHMFQDQGNHLHGPGKKNPGIHTGM